MTTLELTKELDRSKRGFLSYAYSLTNDKVDAFDLYQETIYRVLKNLHHFQPNTNFKAWFTTIMKNSYINTYRKKRNRKTYFDDTNDKYWIDQKAKTVPNQGELNIGYQELLKLIKGLSDKLSLPFLLIYQGYHYKEIAELLDVPLGTVKSRVYEARQKLQKIIDYPDYIS